LTVKAYTFPRELLKAQVESLLKVSENASQNIQALPTIEDQQRTPSFLEEKGDGNSTLSLDSADCNMLAKHNQAPVENEALLDNAALAPLIDEAHLSDKAHDNLGEVLSPPQDSRDLLNQAAISILKTEEMQIFQHEVENLENPNSGAINSSSAPDYSRALVLQTNIMVHKLTNRVLSHSSPAVEWSWESARSTQKKSNRNNVRATRPDRKEKEKDSRQSADLSTEMIPTLQPTDAEGNEQTVLHNDNQEASLLRGEREERADQSDNIEFIEASESESETNLEIESDLSEATVSRLSERISDMIQHSMVDKIAELQTAKTAAENAKIAAESEAASLRPGDDLLKAPLKFKDAVGRKFTFPWHLCKTWKVS
jgi:hypothetical protein